MCVYETSSHSLLEISRLHFHLTTTLWLEFIFTLMKLCYCKCHIRMHALVSCCKSFFCLVKLQISTLGSICMVLHELNLTQCFLSSRPWLMPCGRWALWFHSIQCKICHVHCDKYYKIYSFDMVFIMAYIIPMLHFFDISLWHIALANHKLISNCYIPFFILAEASSFYQRQTLNLVVGFVISFMGRILYPKALK